MKTLFDMEGAGGGREDASPSQASPAGAPAGRAKGRDARSGLRPAADAEPLIVDSFAGGGGASTGIEMALGRSPDIAINHNADALAMHQVNHPGTLHLSKNIWQVDPLEAVGHRRVGLAWFSPDCRHFSKAKGGRPVKRSIRDLAWVVVLWARRVRPEVIILENVEEFRDWGPVSEDGRPCRERKGQTFERWTAELKRLGYRMEWRELRACDYGAPTIRKRFFMIARRDGLPIVWPQRTHGDPRKADDAKLIEQGRLKPWRTAAEIIDWSIPCPSIFDSSEAIFEKFGVRAIRPLADATMRRIARGVVRYVLEAKKPFVVKFQSNSTGHGIDEPLATVTANSFVKRPGGAAPLGVVQPFVVPVTHAGDLRSNPSDEPLRTQTTAHRGEHALVVPSIVRNDMASAADRNGVNSPGEPLRTQTTAGSHAVVAPYLVPRYGERDGQDPRTRPVTVPAPVVVPDANEGSLAAVHLTRQFGASVGSGADQPVGTITARGGGKAAVVAAFLAQHNSGNDGHDAMLPVSTLTAGGQFGVSQQGIVAAHLSWAYTSNTRGGEGDLEKPAKTILAGGQHAALISGFLMKYYGTGGQWAKLDDPAHTDTSRDRMGLVTVEIDGQTYAIADIGMRMLTPRERFRAQGFPDGYVIDRRPDGSAITATVQGSCCGNSVCPPVAEAIVRANCGHLARMREAAE